MSEFWADRLRCGAECVGAHKIAYYAKSIELALKRGERSAATLYCARAEEALSNLNESLL